MEKMPLYSHVYTPGLQCVRNTGHPNWQSLFKQFKFQFFITPLNILRVFLPPTTIFTAESTRDFNVDGGITLPPLLAQNFPFFMPGDW